MTGQPQGSGQGCLKPIRVLAADDSAVMRGVYRLLFGNAAQTHERSRSPKVELCGIAEDGVACLAAVESLRPDVLILDVEMPRMNGLEVLLRLREQVPSLPVILCSSATEFGARVTLEALALGAADYVTKTGLWSSGHACLDALREQLLPKLELFALRAWAAERPALCPPGRRESVRERVSAPHAPVEVIVVGVSTGGPSALELVLPHLPAAFPVPVLIAQHMPKLFTRALAERFDRCCALPVREAYDGAEVRGGEVWIAPGGADMEIFGRANGPGTTMRLRLRHELGRNFCTPSADVLFRSAARSCGAGTLALVMTGMGADGLVGARRVHHAGGTVLAQDEATSAVWGMPGRVFEAGIVRRLLPVNEIADELISCVSSAGGERMWASRPPAREVALGMVRGAHGGRTHGLY